MELAARTGAWSKSGSPTPAAYGGLRFTAEADNSSVQLTAVGSAPVVTLVKSFDGVNWEAYAVGEVIDLPGSGDCVYLAAGEGGNETFGSSSSVYHQFVINGLVAASGDITSIRRFDLEQTTLNTFCYGYLFEGCTGLTSAPELPATTLAKNCYRQMFKGCTGLTSAPELPATTIATGCYASMFEGCTGLTSAPELPATTLASNCYASMFRSCTGLTSAPELPAIKLANNCYTSMFRSCKNISIIKIHFTLWDISAFNGKTNDWVNGVASIGTFYKPSALPEEYGTSKIPPGWTVVNID